MKLSVILSKEEFHRILASGLSYSSDVQINDFYQWADEHVTFELLTNGDKLPPKEQKTLETVTEPPTSYPPVYDIPPPPSLASASGASDDGASDVSIEHEIPF